MNKDLYVGNLSLGITAEDLIQEFSRYGEVIRALIVRDALTNVSRGFGYVEMSEGGDEAIANMDGLLYRGRSLHVHHAKPLVGPTWPNGDERESIPVMPDYPFRGWPLCIIDPPPGGDGSWTSLYDDPPATRDTEASSASENDE